MAYKTGSNASAVTIINALADFAATIGFTVVAQDSKVPYFPGLNSYALPNPRTMETVNGASLVASTSANNIKRVRSGYWNATTTDMQPVGSRLVLRDGNGAYFHLFGITNVDGCVDGIETAVDFLECWVSDGWAGASADIHAHGGLAKLGCGGPYRNANAAYHMFGGVNPRNGKHYVNIAIETIAESFEHFSFGTIETYADIACGEFTMCSGQRGAGYAAPSTSYSGGTITNANASIVVSHLGVALVNASDRFLLQLTDGNLSMYGTGTYQIADRINAITLRHSQFGKTKSLAAAAGITNVGNSFASAGQKSEYLIQPVVFAGLPVQNLTPNSYSGVSVFAPMYAGVYSPLENDMWAMLGEYPNQRYINIANNNPKDIIAYGDDEWMVFPLHRKGATTYNGTFPVISGNHGIAYKK